MNLEVPLNITLTNISDEIQSFRYFKVNMLQKVLPGQTIKLTITNSDELGYYKEIINDNLTMDDIIVKSLEVTEAPTKTSYIVGEVFNPEGMKVVATLEGGRTMIVTDYSISPSGELTLEDTSIEISYDGKSTAQEITVQEDTITSIAVTTPPTKVNYVAGETFDTTGMVITGTYLSGNTDTISIDLCDLTPSTDTPLETTDTQITIQYNDGQIGLQTTQTITVTEEIDSNDGEA